MRKHRLAAFMVLTALAVVVIWNFPTYLLFRSDPEPEGDIVYPQSINELVEDSDLIFIGTIGRIMVDSTPDLVTPEPTPLPTIALYSSRVQLDVEQMLLDDGGSRPVMYDRRGRPAGRRSPPQFWPFAEVGDRFLFFLTRDDRDERIYYVRGGCGQIVLGDSGPECSYAGEPQNLLFMQGMSSDDFVADVKRAIAGKAAGLPREAWLPTPDTLATVTPWWDPVHRTTDITSDDLELEDHARRSEIVADVQVRGMGPIGFLTDTGDPPWREEAAVGLGLWIGRIAILDVVEAHKGVEDGVAGFVVWVSGGKRDGYELDLRPAPKMQETMDEGVAFLNLHDQSVPDDTNPFLRLAAEIVDPLGSAEERYQTAWLETFYARDREQFLNWQHGDWVGDETFVREPIPVDEFYLRLHAAME